MSVRSLAFVATLLGGLLAAVVMVSLDRLGHLQDWDVPGWRFENALLKVKSGTYVVVRSADPDGVKFRFMFERTVTEPTVNRDREPKPTDPPPMPYVLLWMETMGPGDNHWRFARVSYAALAQIGARTTQEWLEELGPVREVLRDGTTKIMLRARFGLQNGAQAIYFFDPNEPDPSIRGFGWTRMEAYGAEPMPHISYTIPAGRYVRR